MLAKFKIDYAVPFHRHEYPEHHLTDDPVACQEFLAELLARKFRIRGILHNGVPLESAAFDQMLRTAAGLVAADHICSSLGIDSVEARHRFGTPA